MFLERSLPLPKLRNLEVFPLEQPSGTKFLVRDPLQFSNATIVLNKEAFFILSMLNGENTLLDIQSAFFRKFGRILFTEEVEKLLQALDDALFIENARFLEHRKKIEDNFSKSPIRHSVSLASGYPKSKDEFQRLISNILSLSEPQKIDSKPIGLVAPHIDYERGKRAYSSAYRAIESITSKTFIILGTNHFGLGGVCVLTLKDFSTPLGVVQTNKEVANIIINKMGSKVFEYELDHRIEHSIELQLPFLQYLFGADIKIVPILCSFTPHSLVEEPSKIEGYQEFIEILQSLLNEHKGDLFLISAADLAHIGPRFGSSEPLTDTNLALSKSKDIQMLDSLTSKCCGAFYRYVFSELNERHVCGLAPIDLIDNVLSNSNRFLLYYEQWYDINRMSSVSFASVLFTE